LTTHRVFNKSPTPRLAKTIFERSGMGAPEPAIEVLIFHKAETLSFEGVDLELTSGCHRLTKKGASLPGPWTPDGVNCPSSSASCIRSSSMTLCTKDKAAAVQRGYEG
jgi:hypothetical protein